MEKNALQVPPIENAADYVDALTRPLPQDSKAAKWKFIEGRRMRDKFLDSVIVPDTVSKQLPPEA